MSKEYLRKLIKDARDNINQTEREKHNNIIFDLLTNSDFFKNCQSLYIFMSFGSEVDTIRIINEALNQGKKLYLPRILNKNMEFYKIDSLDRLKKNKFGFLEPDASYEIDNKIYNNCNRLMIVPGIAFDIYGNRIGYGGGYYDKFLSRHGNNFIKLGIAYDVQLINHIYKEQHDISLDYIVTNKGFIERKVKQ